MNGINKSLPHLGGKIRVAFNGGESVRRSLSFQARSVNIDNWSPYWYLLSPEEVYIPPFQNGVSVPLSLLKDFQFICQAPPGIEQPDIVTSTGISGNYYPVIAVFSSEATNYDAGFSAQEQAANIAVNTVNSGGNSVVTVATIDVTLYNGIYFFIHSRDVYDIEFSFDGPNGTWTVFATYALYNNEQILFTLPKISKHIRIRLLHAILGTFINYEYSYRPFLGYADYSHTRMSYAGANPPSIGNMRQIVGSNAVTFSTEGIDNAKITVKVRAGGGVVFGSLFWVRIFLGNYADTIGAITLYTKAFQYGNGEFGLLIPISDILQSQMSGLTVAVNTTAVGATTDVSIHHIDEPLGDGFQYAEPLPITNTTIVALVATGTNLFVTFQIGSLFRGLQVSVLAASATAGSNIQFYLGSGVAPIVPIGVIPATVVGAYTLTVSRPIPMFSGFVSIWTATNSAAGLSIGLVALLD